MHPLKILQVNTADHGGGAEKVVQTLHQTYKLRGLRSSVAVGYKYSNDRNYFVFSSSLAKVWDSVWDPDRYISRRFPLINKGKWPVYNHLRNICHPSVGFNNFLGREDFYFPGTWKLTSSHGERPDIIHCHNLHGKYFDLRALPYLSKECPMVLTLHDAWLLGGHCAHSFSCENWQSGCRHCPNLHIPPAIRKDAARNNWKLKKEIYGNSALYVATPCKWLMDKVDRSILSDGIIESKIIPNGVDLTTFHSFEKEKARQQLGLQNDEIIILFAAKAVRDNIWKDFQTMRSALILVSNAYPNKRTKFIALGERASVETIGNAVIHYIPYQSDPKTVALYYQAADIYIHASRADTFPNTILEAQACGTPVVATSVGGIPEQIEDNVTGFLTNKGDAEDMANKIQILIEDESLRMAMSENASHKIREKFDLETQVDTYIDWYKKIRA